LAAASSVSMPAFLRCGRSRRSNPPTPLLK
jgi:hypothetical protein